jgi:hypothetical protein
MSATLTPPSVADHDIRLPAPADADPHLMNRAMSRLMKPLEVTAASLTATIIVLLLVGVLSRYVFSKSIVWVDEVVSISFIWLTMIGTAIAMHRNEHLTRWPWRRSRPSWSRCCRPPGPTPTKSGSSPRQR